MRLKILAMFCMAVGLAACSSMSNEKGALPQPSVPHAQQTAPTLTLPPKAEAASVIPVTTAKVGAPTRLTSGAAPVPRERPAPKSDLVEIAQGVYCSGAIAKESKKRWTRLGAHPFSGTPEEAIGSFIGVPNAVRDAWKRQVAGNKETSGVLKKGEHLCSMMYSKGGKHYLWNRIEVQLDDRAELFTLKYEVEHEGFIWSLEIPPKDAGGCDNWFWRATKKPG